MRTNRYRRDQRQLDEEEEMWFNEDDDFDEGEAVVPATNSSLINKKLNNELDAIGNDVSNFNILFIRKFYFSILPYYFDNCSYLQYR